MIFLLYILVLSVLPKILQELENDRLSKPNAELANRESDIILVILNHVRKILIIVVLSSPDFS